MEVMQNHVWHDNDVRGIKYHGAKDQREIEILNAYSDSSLLISKNDVIALASEMGMVVYDKDTNLVSV